MWEFIVCPKGDFDEWYKKECLYGDTIGILEKNNYVYN